MFFFKKKNLGRLFKNRMVTACFAVNFFQGMSFFAMVYFVPLFFQIVKGATGMHNIIS